MWESVSEKSAKSENKDILKVRGTRCFRDCDFLSEFFMIKKYPLKLEVDS